MTPDFDKLFDQILGEALSNMDCPEIIEEAGKCQHETLRQLSDKKGFRWMRCMENPYSSGIRRVYWGRKDGSFNYNRCNKPQRAGTEAGEACRDYWKARRKQAILRLLKARNKKHDK